MKPIEISNPFFFYAKQEWTASEVHSRVLSMILKEEKHAINRTGLVECVLVLGKLNLMILVSMSD